MLFRRQILGGPCVFITCWWPPASFLLDYSYPPEHTHKLSAHITSYSITKCVQEVQEQQLRFSKCCYLLKARGGGTGLHCCSLCLGFGCFSGKAFVRQEIHTSTCTTVVFWLQVIYCRSVSTCLSLDFWILMFSVATCVLAK